MLRPGTREQMHSEFWLRQPGSEWSEPSSSSRSVRPSDAVGDLHARVLTRALGAAVELALDLVAVPQDPAAAMLAGGGQGMDRALEAVENVRLTIHLHVEGLVVFVAAHFALRHAGASSRGPP